jgi:hypothetical protein
MNKFEQLIEYVINDEDAKARELFHDIVVEKSRQIYEEMMQEEELDEAESTDKEDEKAEKAGEKVTKDIEYDDKKDRAERKMDEGMDEALGGDQADDLIDDIEVEEEGISMEAEDDDDDHHDDMGGNEELEDRVVDLEDKLDELMAEFEALMGDGDEEESEMEMDIDTPDMDAEEVVDDEMETEGMHGMKMPMEEAVQLKSAPAPVKSEEAGVNKKAVYAVDSGAKGAVAKPDNLDQGGEATGRPAPQAKEMIGKVGNTPAQSTQDPKPATKPHLAQATGVNTKSVLKPI